MSGLDWVLGKEAQIIFTEQCITGQAAPGSVLMQAQLNPKPWQEHGNMIKGREVGTSLRMSEWWVARLVRKKWVQDIFRRKYRLNGRVRYKG